MGAVHLIWTAFCLLLTSLLMLPVSGCIFQPDTSSNVVCDSETHEFCKDIGFNTTSFPNVFGHSSYDEAAVFFEGTRAILTLNCSRYAPELLCASVFPLCSPGQFEKVQPCRQFCWSVRETCASAHAHFSWPESLDCEQFPAFGDDICIWETENGDCPEGSPPGVVIPTHIAPTPPPLAATNCSHHLVPLDVSSSAAFGGVEHCTESCDGVFFDDYHQNFMLIWTAAWSLLTMLISVLIFLTYILNFKHISSLEAPIHYISLCFAVVGLVYTVSIAVGRGTLICDEEFTNEFNESALVMEGRSFPLCVTAFSLLYYFTLCTWSWWGVLSIQWFVCTFKEKLLNVKLKVFLHVIAWGVPLIFLSVALALDVVSGDPILNTCWIEKRYEIPFLLVPLLIPLVVCSVVIVVCFAQVIRSHRQRSRNKQQLSGTSHNQPPALASVGTYCAAFMLPAGLLLCVYFYEYWYQSEWERGFLRCAASLGECSSSLKPLFPIFLLKLAASLAMGVFAAFWVVRRSSLVAWKHACCTWQVKRPPSKTESSERFNPIATTPTSSSEPPYFDPQPTPTTTTTIYDAQCFSPAPSEQYYAPPIATPTPSEQYFSASATSSTIGQYFEHYPTPSSVEQYCGPISMATTTDQLYDSNTTPTSVDHHHSSSHPAARFTFSETSV